MTRSDRTRGREPERIPTFCTAINCVDGRVQLPVISYLRERFGVEHVDLVTDPGPVGLLSGSTDGADVQRIRDRVALLCERHQTRGLAVVAHHDCAGNPLPAATQQEQLRVSWQWLQEQFPSLPVVALWVDDCWQVHEVC